MFLSSTVMVTAELVLPPRTLNYSQWGSQQPSLRTVALHEWITFFQVELELFVELPSENCRNSVTTIQSSIQGV